MVIYILMQDVERNTFRAVASKNTHFLTARINAEVMKNRMCKRNSANAEAVWYSQNEAAPNVKSKQVQEFYIDVIQAPLLTAYANRWQSLTCHRADPVLSDALSAVS